MKVNKKNKKPVICRGSIDILENKIKDLLYERETNLKMVETMEEKNLSIIKSQKEIILKLGEEIAKLKKQLVDERETNLKILKIDEAQIERIKKENELFQAIANQHPPTSDMFIKKDAEERGHSYYGDPETLNDFCNEMTIIAKEFSSLKQSATDGWFQDTIDEDIEDIIKEKEKEDNKVIEDLKEKLKTISEYKQETQEQCDTLTEENKALRTYIRNSKEEKLQAKIRQQEEEIRFLRDTCGIKS